MKQYLLQHLRLISGMGLKEPIAFRNMSHPGKLTFKRYI